jgi:radical SAM protein with 4Fe4S-binding SPASM domain
MENNMLDKTIYTEKQDHYLATNVKKEIPHFQSLKYIEYRHAWEENHKLNNVPNYPLNLDLHITNKCNLKCPFCPRTWKDLSGGYDTYGFMSFDLYKKIIDEALKEGVKALHFTANGEPLLHKGLEEMIRYANDNDILEVLLHTNATALTEKRSKSLLDSGIHRLAISFDSPNKENYEKLRVGGNFERTLNNIKRFVEIRDDLGYDLPTVRVQMVVQKVNKTELEEFHELFDNIADHVSHVYYIDYMGGANAFVDKDVIDGEGMAIGKQILNQNFKCSYLWQRLIVEWDGEVYPCFYGYDMPVGDFREQTMKEIWHGDKMRKLRELHSSGNYSKCSTCNKCGRQYDTFETDDHFDN